MKTKRICFYSDFAGQNAGGAQKILKLLLNSMQSEGMDVSVFCPARAKTRFSKWPVSCYPKMYSKRYAVRVQALPFLLRHYQKQPFDLLHCHGTYPSAYVALPFCRMKRIPLVIRPYGSDVLPGDRIFRHPRLAARVKQTLQQADAVVAQGESMKERFLELGVSEERIRIIHNGTIIPESIPDVDVAGSDRPWLGLGSLSGKKGWDIALRAYAQLPKPRRPFFILGEGDQRLSLENLIRDLGIENEVVLPGVIEGDELKQKLASAWALLAPSRREPFSNAILEALAYGLPVLASKVGGNVEMIEDGMNGYLFEPESVDSVSVALKKIDQSGEREHLAAGALESRHAFSLSRMIQSYRELYASLQ